MSGAKSAEPATEPTRFEPYQAYKDSGVEWLGEIPAHWEVKKWRYCCHVTEGQVAPDDHRYRDRVMIAPNHIESGTGQILFTETADEQGAISGKYLVKPGDIIYSKIRPALNKACIATEDWLCSADMYPVKITEVDLTAQFLLYFILSEPFVRLMVDESMRVAMPKVNREKLATCPLVIPTPDEQEAIAAFLDRETARIDALVAKKERLIELLQEKRSALITRAVTKGLDPNVPMKDSGVEWLGEIPAHWEVKRLRRISPSLGVGVVVNPSQYVVDDGLPFLYGSDISEGRIKPEQSRRISAADSRRLPKSQLHPGDLVMVRVGAPGVTAVVPPELDGANCASILVIRRGSGVVSTWLCYALNSRFMRSQVEVVQYGAAQEQFNVSHAVNFTVAVPPVSDQEHIAAFLDRETARIDALVAKVREAVDRLEELRTALISAAVTGKIDVRERAAAS